jgi:hypothetical protein
MWLPVGLRLRTSDGVTFFAGFFNAQKTTWGLWAMLSLSYEQDCGIPFLLLICPIDRKDKFEAEHL